MTVHAVAIAARHITFDYRVMVLKGEFPPDVEVTAKASLRICQNYLALIAVFLGMQRTGTMAGLAPFDLAGFDIFLCNINDHR
jgi:hypothetical protein